MPLAVMIVDDSPAMRAFLRRVLDMSGLDVASYLEAADGHHALELLQEHQIDVILSDTNMPAMNGEQLVRSLQADARLRSIPVVVVSTDRTGTRVQPMLSLGARGYVAKPFFPDTLRAELERALEGSHYRV